MENQTASFDLAELEAELDHVLDCTRALRERLKQANLTVTAIVAQEDSCYRISLPSCSVEEAVAAQPGKE